MIRTPRVRMATAPDDESAAAIADATPATLESRRSSRVAMLLVAGGLVVIVIASLAVLVPRLLGAGGAEGPADVADIPNKPALTWTFDWVGDADPALIEDAPVVSAVGDDRALVWATFDYYAYEDSQGSSTAWYEGYDEQYDDGFEAGERWSADYDAYWESTSLDLPYPEQEKYYPEGAFGDYENWLGFDDGFYDAAYDNGRGFSKKEEPVAPEYSPTLTLLDTSSGKAVWTVDLAEAIDGADFTTSFYAIDVPGSDAVVVSSSTTDKDSGGYAVVALSKADGSVVSALESDGPMAVGVIDADVLVTATGKDGKNPTIARYPVTGLGDEPEWRVDGPESTDAATVSNLGADYIQVVGEDDGVILRAESGRAAGFGEDVRYGISYYYAGHQLVRLTSEDDEATVEGWNDSGDSSWGDPVAADYARVIDGMVLVADADGDSFSGLAAIDPSTGERLWSKPWGGDFDGVYGVRNGTVLVISGSRLVVLDASTGEQRFAQELGDVSGFYEGADGYYVYTGDRLTAYGYGETGGRWSLRVDTSETVIAIGRSLGLVDADKGTLRGLA